jgi:hypothetical protein
MKTLLIASAAFATLIVTRVIRRQMHVPATEGARSRGGGYRGVAVARGIMAATGAWPLLAVIVASMAAMATAIAATGMAIVPTAMV